MYFIQPLLLLWKQTEQTERVANTWEYGTSSRASPVAGAFPCKTKLVGGGYFGALVPHDFFPAACWHWFLGQKSYAVTGHISFTSTFSVGIERRQRNAENRKQMITPPHPCVELSLFFFHSFILSCPFFIPILTFKFPTLLFPLRIDFPMSNPTFLGSRVPAAPSTAAPQRPRMPLFQIPMWQKYKNMIKVWEKFKFFYWHNSPYSLTCENRLALALYRPGVLNLPLVA